jgi:multiple sugar transport system permease protein
MIAASARVAGPTGRAGWMKWGFVGPTLLLLVAFNVFPLLWNVVLGFRSTELVGDDGRYVGAANYARVFADPQYAEALRLTARFVALAVGIELGVGFALALALRRDFRGKGVVLTALLVPMMLPPAVVGLFWNLILDGNYGILNQLLGALGLPAPQWTTDRDWKFASVLLVELWMWTPFMLLIALAALHAIPPSLYEAAAIDRAGRFTVFRRITLPLAAPLLGLAVLLRATDALKQFDLVMSITGPNDSTTQTLSTLLFQVVFRDGKVGLGAGYACVVLVAVIALATIFTRYLDALRERSA